MKWFREIRSLKKKDFFKNIKLKTLNLHPPKKIKLILTLPFEFPE